MTKTHKHKYFEKYGGAGIIICDELHHSFEELYKWSLLNGHKGFDCWYKSSIKDLPNVETIKKYYNSLFRKD